MGYWWRVERGCQWPPLDLACKCLLVSLCICFVRFSMRVFVLFVLFFPIEVLRGLHLCVTGFRLRFEEGLLMARVPQCAPGIGRVHADTWPASGAPGEGPLRGPLERLGGGFLRGCVRVPATSLL